VDVDNIVIGKVLGWKRTRRRTVEEVKKRGGGFEGFNIDATRGVLDNYQVLETGNSGRFESCAGKITHQLLV